MGIASRYTMKPQPPGDPQRKVVLQLRSPAIQHLYFVHELEYLHLAGLFDAGNRRFRPVVSVAYLIEQLAERVSKHHNAVLCLDGAAQRVRRGNSRQVMV